MVHQADRTAASIASIVALARELFAKHGYHDVTIDQVAIGARVAKRSVHYHLVPRSISSTTSLMRCNRRSLEQSRPPRALEVHLIQARSPQASAPTW